MEEQAKGQKDRFVVFGSLRVDQRLLQDLVLQYLLAQEENVRKLYEKVRHEPDGDVGFWWLDNAEIKMLNGEPAKLEIVFGRHVTLSDEECQQQDLEFGSTDGYFVCNKNESWRVHQLDVPEAETSQKEPSGSKP
jgi:hypothetical protein